MTWIKISERMPEKDGNYDVVRNWSETQKVSGHCVFKDGKWIDRIADACGEIIEWYEE